MEKETKDYKNESIGYYSAMAQVMTYMIESKNDSIDDFIVEFEFKEKDFKKHLDSEDYSSITNNVESMNDKAKNMWVS